MVGLQIRRTAGGPSRGGDPPEVGGSLGPPRPATGMNISVIRFVGEIAARSANQTLEETRETSRIYTA